ncbi:MAG: hypothetical protein C0600_12585 [Ignavibacteria bacterium]|nr:MAG: hypothetical protein C0600_12585 [Ignavibacteria bacterium]
MLTSLRSGNPQRILFALNNIDNDQLARTLYVDLYQIAGSEPSSPITASAAAKALGFVLLVGRDAEMQPMSEEEFAEKISMLEALLENINPEVTGVVEQFQWRAVELMQYCTAYDFYRGITGKTSPSIEERLSHFADNAAQQLENSFVIRNNLSLKLAAAAGIAGIILRDTDALATRRSPQQWLGIAIRHIDETIWEYQSNPDGWYGYSEGPWYFRYAMMNLIPFFLAFDTHLDGGTFAFEDRIFESPLRDARYHTLFDWISALRMPDGMLPPFEDTYMKAYFPELASIGGVLPAYQHLAWPNYGEDLAPMEAARFSRELSRTFDGRVDYLISAPPTPAHSTMSQQTWIMPDAGYAVFRSGWEADASYFALIGKHGIARTHRSPVGSGHKQANETAFVLQAGGELLALEPGYHSSKEREALVYGANHNVILVDGRGADSTSFGTSLFGADSFIQDTISTQEHGSVTIRTHYQDADIERSASHLHHRFFMITDRAESGFTRMFTHQLHGNGTLSEGSFVPSYDDHSAQWTSGSMRLHAITHALGSDVTHETVSRLHAPSSSTFAKHDAMYSSVTSDRGLFHSVLYAASTDEDVSTRVLVNAADVSVIHVQTPVDELLSLMTETASHVQTSVPEFGEFSTDAKTFHCILDAAGRPESWMLDDGSFIRHDDRMLLSSSLELQATVTATATHYRLSVRADGALQLRLRVPYHVSHVAGNGISAWEMDGNAVLLKLTDGIADCSLEFNTVATSVEQSHAIAQTCRIHAPYPQPFLSGSGAALIIPVEIAATHTAAAVLYDALGRKSMELPVRRATSGPQPLLIAAESLRPGTYYLRLQADGQSAVKRFIIH